VLAVLPLAGACGTQNLVFDPLDGSDAADAAGTREASPESSALDARQPPSSCKVDDDCPLPDLHCDSAGQCVACVTDRQCQSQSSEFPVCASNQCVECGDDADCGPDGQCEPMSHRCVLPCADSGACPSSSGLLCYERTGLCVACTSNAYCQNQRSGPVCDPLVGRCVQCVDNSDCGSRAPICDRFAGRCVECLSAQSCRPGEACDPVEHACVPAVVVELEGGPAPFTDGGVRMP
jgi:hypothetical protein